MSDHNDAVDGATPAVEPKPEPPVVEGVESRVARLEERMDDTEAVAGAALMMHLEDDVDEEPERTEVEPRSEPEPEKKEEAAAQATSTDRHAGLFL